MCKCDSLLWACVLVAALSASAGACADDAAERQRIRETIATFYDKPANKVETDPVVIADSYAIADWTQGARGGRALLRLDDGKWSILACGADGFKDPTVLAEAGIPEPTARQLTSRLADAEQSVDAGRLQQFSLFGTRNDPVTADQSHHH